ncbi:protein phosphatase 1 regulatory inhibitor subunit 1B [Phyllostomus discolor]|uniref:Protein phosphatase 1 regulatory inhibitor subunit 1B n=1 Tax=Phyllostomus discolor TaxID=89673 RepID=A0A833ZPC8_9CHIR|nr:protein phosphatase 1 regulatory inhibitor subunit 1B [Phyllostomus discolor]
MASHGQSCPSPALSPLYHDEWTLRVCGFIFFFFLSQAGQKTTCGQGLEGPWERPPPLDEPQKDGSSEDQVEDPTLSEPGEDPQRSAHTVPGT